MIGRLAARVIVFVAACLLVVAAAASTARYRNCKALNARYSHGVGRSVPVTTPAAATR
jgi:hypothetical protein